MTLRRWLLLLICSVRLLRSVIASLATRLLIYVVPQTPRLHLPCPVIYGSRLIAVIYVYGYLRYGRTVAWLDLAFDSGYDCQLRLRYGCYPHTLRLDS